MPSSSTSKRAAPSWVVLSIVQDGGWSARDAAGRALPLSRANGPFLALKVPAGSTHVRMRYRPPGFVPGAWISGATLVILAAVGASPRRAERCRVSHPGSPFWVPSAALQAHLNLTATGRADCDWLSHVRATHLPARVPRTLVLGCGNGFLERALARQDGIGEILATDPDAAAVEAAAKAARREGFASITHARLDPGQEPLPGSGWNLILAHDLLHHVSEPGDRSPGASATLSLPEASSCSPNTRGRLAFSTTTSPWSSSSGTSGCCPTASAATRTADSRSGAASASTRSRLERESPHEAAQSHRLLPLARRMLRRRRRALGRRRPPASPALGLRAQLPRGRFRGRASARRALLGRGPCDVSRSAVSALQRLRRPPSGLRPG